MQHYSHFTQTKINLLQPKLILPLFGLSAGVALFVWFLSSLQPCTQYFFRCFQQRCSIWWYFLAIIAGGLYSKKIDLFDAFVDGAKEVLKRQYELFLTW
ncbi:MAG: hypothetical protein R2847_00445 [Bacteroidia bacterium]